MKLLVLVLENRILGSFSIKKKKKTISALKDFILSWFTVRAIKGWCDLRFSKENKGELAGEIRVI